MGTKTVPIKVCIDGEWEIVGEAVLDPETGFFEGTVNSMHFSGFATHIDEVFVRNNSYLEIISSNALIGPTPKTEVNEVENYPGPNQSSEKDEQDWNDAKDAGSNVKDPMPDASRQSPDDK